MLFNSYTFLLFLVFVVVLSYLIRSWRSRKVFLLTSSYLFYSAWNPPFVVLLFASTITDWLVAKKIHKTNNTSSKKAFLCISLVLNLGLLAYFKYGNFILDNFILLLTSVGVDYHPAKLDIILPVGISFYTFQTLSYTIDIYRGETKPWHSFLDYALYVTFFPQLVAGPIVRATEFLPQCLDPKSFDLRKISWGISLLIIGLFNKVVIADSFLSPIVEQVYGTDEILTFFQAWAGTVAFSFQILCDFSGYSLCAIGVALTLGFALPDNFRSPYAAIGFSDFWRRWHISLSSWLRDYLYIPLGGNRKGELRTLINLMLTMLIGGLWHGASWLFVFWGGLHGFYLIVERTIIKLKLSRSSLWENTRIKQLLAIITYALVCIAWVFFRAKSLQSAFDILSSMFGLNSFGLNGALHMPKKDLLVVTLTALSYLSIHWHLRDKYIEDIFLNISWQSQAAFITVATFIITISMSGAGRAFIYFQF